MRRIEAHVNTFNPVCCLVTFKSGFPSLHRSLWQRIILVQEKQSPCNSKTIFKKPDILFLPKDVFPSIFVLSIYKNWKEITTTTKNWSLMIHWNQEKSLGVVISYVNTLFFCDIISSLQSMRTNWTVYFRFPAMKMSVVFGDILF